MRRDRTKHREPLHPSSSGSRLRRGRAAPPSSASPHTSRDAVGRQRRDDDAVPEDRQRFNRDSGGDRARHTGSMSAAATMETQQRHRRARAQLRLPAPIASQPTPPLGRSRSANAITRRKCGEAGDNSRADCEWQLQPTPERRHADRRLRAQLHLRATARAPASARGPTCRRSPLPCRSRQQGCGSVPRCPVGRQPMLVPRVRTAGGDTLPAGSWTRRACPPAPSATRRLRRRRRRRCAASALEGIRARAASHPARRAPRVSGRRRGSSLPGRWAAERASADSQSPRSASDRVRLRLPARSLSR